MKIKKKLNFFLNFLKIVKFYILKGATLIFTLIQELTLTLICTLKNDNFSFFEIFWENLKIQLPNLYPS